MCPRKEAQRRGWCLLPLHLGVGVWWTQKSWSAKHSDQHLVKACYNTCLGNAMCYFRIKTRVRKRKRGLACAQAQEEWSARGVKPLPKLTCPTLGNRKCFPYLYYKCDLWALTERNYQSHTFLLHSLHPKVHLNNPHIWWEPMAVPVEAIKINQNSVSLWCSGFLI